MEIQSSRRTSFWGSLGTIGQKLQKMAILGNRSMRDESLTTTMRLVEQTMNERPITPANDDPSNLEALTPSHFILGRANVCMPKFSSHAEIYSNHRKNFRSCQVYAEMIWKRWVSEYLPQNNVRTQRNKSEANFRVGDLV